MCIIPKKKRLPHFYSYYQLWQILSKLRSTRYVDNYDAGFNIFSLPPKSVLETQLFEKKGYSSNGKKLGQFFS